MQKEGAYTVEVMILMEYVESKEDPLIQPTSHRIYNTSNN